MMCKDYKFIITKDITTKNKLLDLGYLMINSSNSFFIFQNKKDLDNLECFEKNKIECSKLKFTNKMFL